jgi:hypothetical protein
MQLDGDVGIATDDDGIFAVDRPCRIADMDAARATRLT